MWWILDDTIAGGKIMSQFMRPLCNVCGFELAGKIGTVIVVCVVCGTEFDLVKRN